MRSVMAGHKARNVEGRDEYLQRVTTDRQEQIMLSYLGRVAYNFDKRYNARGFTPLRRLVGLRP